MPSLTAEMQELINKNQCYVATADKTGRPNLGPKGSTRVLDENTIYFAEVTAGQTLANLRENPRAAIVAVDVKNRHGYRFVGTARIIEEGELLERAKEQLASFGLIPKAVVTVTVEEIYSLDAGSAGKRLA